MAWAQEIIDFVLKLKPWTTVDEYQTGLYFVLGKVVERRIPEKKLAEMLERKKASQRAEKVRIDEEDPKRKSLGIEEIIKLEERANSRHKNPKVVPSNYKGWHLRRGRLEHPERYNKNIPYGIYFHFPEVLDITRVVALPAREVVKDLKFISTLVRTNSGEMVPYRSALKIGNSKEDSTIYTQGGADTTPEHPQFVSLFLSGFVKYELEDGYKAFTGVQDWERSYHSKVLMTMSEFVREQKLEDWSRKNVVNDVENKIKNALNGAVREKWGIWTSEVGITDAVPHGLVRSVQELYVPDEGLKLSIYGG